MAAGPVMSLDDIVDSNCYYDSDPEILLSDSDEEDEDPVMEGGDADAETTIGSDDLQDSDGEESIDCDVDAELSPPLPSDYTSIE